MTMIKSVTSDERNNSHQIEKLINLGLNNREVYKNKIEQKFEWKILIIKSLSGRYSV